jgi:hypothetical protein
VAAQPQQLRPDRLLRDRRAGALQHVGPGQGFPQLGDLAVGSRVVLQHRRAQRASIGIEADHRGHHPGDADGGYRAAPRAGDRLGRQLQDVGPPLLRILFGPARPCAGQRHRPFVLRDHTAPDVKQQALGHGRADVDGKQQPVHDLDSSAESAVKRAGEAGGPTHAPPPRGSA